MGFWWYKLQISTVYIPPFKSHLFQTLLLFDPFEAGVVIDAIHIIFCGCQEAGFTMTEVFSMLYHYGGWRRRYLGAFQTVLTVMRILF